ncbi:MAG: lipid asymmetry maintenance protein MlaB [Hydrogenophaga sp.]
MPDHAAAARLPGRLTLERAVPTLEQLSAALLQTDGVDAVLDGADLGECDSSAVAVLLELRRVLQANGRTLRLCNSPQRLRDLVALYGVQELLPTV